jgi:hypothetical protein
MTADELRHGALTDLYRNLLDAGSDTANARYTGTLPDGTTVAILVLSAEISNRAGHPDAFFTVIGRAAQVPHDGVAKAVAWGRTVDGRLHCAFARGDGAELTPGRPAFEVAALGAHLARALAAAHSSGIVHGALSTERLFRARDGSARFDGLGVHAGLCAAGVGVQDASSALSSAPYLSPEQRQGGEPDERSDVYALGASLYELLTGKPPFGGRTTSYVMANVLSDEAPDQPDEKAKDPSEPIIDAILRAIERAPDDRWATAAAFADALDAGSGRSSASRVKARRGAGCVPGAAVAVTAAAALLHSLFGR